jgi:hypothetical protein
LSVIPERPFLLRPIRVENQNISVKNLDFINFISDYAFIISSVLANSLANGILYPSYEEINHEEIMRFYVRECVEDKEIRKQLFDILKRNEYMDAYLDKLRELNLYDDFVGSCGDVYIQIFKEWADKNDLDFK